MATEVTSEYYKAIEPQNYKQPTGKRFRQLGRAMEASYRALEPFRYLNRNLVEEYAGPAYGQSGGSQNREKFVNKLNQAVDAYTMMLAANRPQVEITTNLDSLQHFARHFSGAMNNLIKEIHLEKTIQRWVLDAFFCVGIVKVHLADSFEVQLEEDLWMDPGMIFASNVSIDNVVLDMSATKASEMKFIGDYYRIPFEDLKAGVKEGIYDKAVAKDLVPNSKYQLDEARLDRISKGYETDFDEFEPMIDLADVWVKRDNKIYTFPMNKRENFVINPKPLAEIEWEDPEAPPYCFLSFADVPENIMPISPATHLMALDRLINNTLRKQARKAKRLKQIHVFAPSDKESAQRIRGASDGEMISVLDPKDHATLNIGNVDANLQAFTASALDLIDNQSGNVTALLGLGAQSRTVGQEQLIHSASNRKIGQMQNRVVDGVKELLRSMGFLLWQDEFKTIVSKIEVDDGGTSIDVEWRPGDREGNFWDYNFDINLYSMTYQPPAQQVETVNMLLTQIYAPFMEALMQQGGQINFQVLRDIHAEQLNMPKLRQLVQFGQPLPSQEQQPQTTLKGPVRPSNTTRNYVRQHNPAPENQQESIARTMDRSTPQNGAATNGAAY